MTSTDELTKDKSRRLLQLTVLFLREMGVAWVWSQRAVIAVKQIAEKWLKEDSLKVIGLTEEKDMETQSQMQHRAVFYSDRPSCGDHLSEVDIEPEMAFLESSLVWDNLLQADPNSEGSMFDIWRSELFTD
jgi:hypothetical protein